MARQRTDYLRRRDTEVRHPAAYRGERSHPALRHRVPRGRISFCAWWRRPLSAPKSQLQPRRPIRVFHEV